MPRYFFHCADGGRDPDLCGSELPDDASARIEAMRFAGSVLQSAPQIIWDKGQWRVEVTGTDNALLFTVITIAINAPKPNKAIVSHPANDDGGAPA